MVNSICYSIPTLGRDAQHSRAARAPPPLRGGAGRASEAPRAVAWLQTQAALPCNGNWKEPAGGALRHQVLGLKGQVQG